MATKDPSEFLQALLSREYATDDYLARKAIRDSGEQSQPRVITISRDYGALGEEIAATLGDCLKIPVYGPEILDLVAERARTDKFYLQHLDEQGSAGVTTFLYSLISGSTATLQSYRRHLYDVVLDLAKKDCILIGRGAHLILSGKPIFRLRVVGSRLVCAQRIAHERGLSLADAERKVGEIDGKRHQSISNLFGEQFEHCSLENAANFDLVLNTDHFPVPSAVSITLLALRETGFALQNPNSKE